MDSSSNVDGLQYNTLGQWEFRKIVPQFDGPIIIRFTYKAICKTAGSIMNQYCGKNRFLQQEIFNIEKFNLEHLHLLCKINSSL